MKSSQASAWTILTVRPVIDRVGGVNDMRETKKPSRLFDTMVPASIRGMNAFFECYGEGCVPMQPKAARARGSRAEATRPRVERPARIW